MNKRDKRDPSEANDLQTSYSNFSLTHSTLAYTKEKIRILPLELWKIIASTDIIENYTAFVFAVNVFGSHICKEY
jgi:hypothetical protein